MCRAALVLLLLAAATRAQAGDAKDDPGTVQAAPPAWMQIPPAPVRTPAEALASFRIEPGYRIELVAAEPLVEDPVAIAFDAASRLWVVEMRGFMPNADGEGESEPNGRIVVLEDRDRDGTMDHRTVFLDGLALPRAVLPLGGGEALVLAPPRFWHCRDRDGDLACDEREAIGGEFPNGFSDPEHAANTPLFGIDGWIHVARYDRRARYDGSVWVWEPVAFGGQWGLTRDDLGTWFFNTNSDHLRGHFAPPHYAARHRGLARPAFADQRVGADQTVWPDRITPGVNRGYKDGTLRDDGRLRTFTAVCGPGVYRGELMPELRGDVLIPEPAAHVVRRERVTAEGTRFVGRNACDGEREFWASQDERFRPVSATTGPDGGLYVVDMYRGLIQHRNYLTTYLRRQVEDRGLAGPIHCGRIWRVVPADLPQTRVVAWPDLSDAAPQRLVEALAGDNGTVRDLAQRELVRRGLRDAGPSLRRLAGDRTAAASARVTALWTLDALDALDRASLFVALVDRDVALREHGWRLAEPRVAVAGRDDILLGRLLALARAVEPAARVRMQMAFTLGAVSHADPGARIAAEAELRAMLCTDAADAVLRDAVLAGLAGSEARFLRAVAFDPAWRDAGREQRGACQRLAQAGFAVADPSVRLELLEVAADPELGAVADLALAGIVAALPRRGTRPVELRGDPVVVDRIAARVGAEGRQQVERLREAIVWGEAAQVRPLDAVETRRFEQGRGLFVAHCAQCHQPDGAGLGGLAPPLRGSEWVLGAPERLARIVLHGLTGPIEVAGERYEFPLMPDHGRLSDDELAAVLTYVRRGWDHVAEPVTPADVAGVRATERGRGQPWTAAELARFGD
ncbi:MAG: c-type cytochrome [Planctomycetes bacterium]|nr:c-type cytochrome [Planctomycetota bacterium]